MSHKNEAVTTPPISLTLHRGVDLWIENSKNPFSSWAEAFREGFELARTSGGEFDVPYDDYTIVKGCKCQIGLQNSPFEVRARNLAVVFYRSCRPVRLLLASILSDSDALIAEALSVAYGDQTLGAYLRTQLACVGKMVFMNTPVPAEAFGPGIFCEPPVYPFGTSGRLVVNLKSKLRQQKPTGSFGFVDAEYIYRDNFRMQVTVETAAERFENSYHGALICRNDEALYPLFDRNFITQA